jgi:CYTH domain-containing protein
MIEKEKRWHLNDNIPEDKIKKVMHISQSYSNFNPDVRIRKTIETDSVNYSHTVKYNIDLDNREEIEQDITEESYNNILNFIGKKPLIKDRYLVDIDNGLFAEVDHFLDVDKWVVEVEFASDEQMNNFVKLDWFGEEVESGRQFNKQIFSNINAKNDIYAQVRNKYNIKIGGD